LWSLHNSSSLPLLPSHTFLLLQRGFVFMGFSFLQGISTLSIIRSSPDCSVHICSTVVLHGLQGDNLHHHDLLHMLQGNICSGAWNISSDSFFTDLGVYVVLSLTFSHSSLSELQSSVLLFLECPFPEAPPFQLLGSAVPCSGVAGASWNHLCLTWGSPGLSSQRLLFRPPAASAWAPGPFYLHHLPSFSVNKH